MPQRKNEAVLITSVLETWQCVGKLRATDLRDKPSFETRFAKADTDQSGNVEWEEFENALADLRVQLCFKNLGCLGS